MRRTAVMLAVIPALFSQPGFAQNALFTPVAESTGVVQSLPSAPRINMSRHHVETSVSLGAMGQLTATRISDTSSAFITQSLSPSAGFLATFQQSFRPWLGYSVNFGYTRATYRYTAPALAFFTGSAGEINIPNNVYETSVSYIARKHLTERITVFGEAGGGAISFAAINKDIRYSPGVNFDLIRSNTYRPEGIAGFGIDYRLAHGLGLRAEYRGLFIKYPDYGSGNIRLTTVISQPTLSVTYNFGKHSKR